MNTFTYADDSNWEDWQKEYKFGAFYIFPPSEVIESVDALRKKYDPKSDSYCQAHISLSESLAGPLSESQLQELKEVLLTINSFEIQYGPLRSYPPYPGVTYTIKPEDKFFQLRSAIHDTSLFKNIELRHKDIPPHMTIAEFITMERTNELLSELDGNVPEGEFLCGSVEYAIPNTDFYFERIATLPLGK